MQRILHPLWLIVLLLIGQGLFAQNSLSKAERQKAITHLKNSQKDLFNSIKGLSDEQLNFKPNKDAWSIAECVEHITKSEKGLFGLTQASLEGESQPELRKELKYSDEQIVEIITDRSFKAQAPAEQRPNNDYGSVSGTKSEFKKLRKQSIKFMKSSNADMRNHFFDFPFGKVDSYQLIMFMSGHSVRHTQQIKEILADASFPSS